MTKPISEANERRTDGTIKWTMRPNTRSNKSKLYHGYLITSHAKTSDWVIEGHLDLGRFTMLDRAMEAVDKLRRK